MSDEATSLGNLFSVNGWAEKDNKGRVRLLRSTECNFETSLLPAADWPLDDCVSMHSIGHWLGGLFIAIIVDHSIAPNIDPRTCP